MSQDRVPGYEEQEPMERTVYESTRIHEYEMPFNYPNVEVNRPHYLKGHKGVENHGVELLPTKTYDQKDVPPDAIVINEERPIVSVTVIGSTCTPPGYVKVEAEPVERWGTEDEHETVLPVRYREGDLWGQHLRTDQLDAAGDNKQFPQAGMSSAHFDIPRSETVKVMGGSEPPGWTDDQFADDNHYSFRAIRLTVVD
mgnify:CR=1 FL=1